MTLGFALYRRVKVVSLAQGNKEKSKFGHHPLAQENLCQPPAPQIVGEFTWITPGINATVTDQGLISGDSPTTEHPKGRSWVWKLPERGPCDRDCHSC